ncbi:hypothetical protein AAE478_004030 [Parahypoxylon ruwenzoriense]
MPSSEDDFVQDFPYTSNFFTTRELLITDSTASDVVSKISTGEWTALEVIKATCKRTAVAQQLLNCITEIYFEQAFARAAELDEYFQSRGKTVGPLHGLPISLKDQFNLEGVDSTIGYASWAGIKPQGESTLVELLRDAGVVFYVKANVPTTLMTGKTVNNLFGRTLNPRNRKLTPGGSSGGNQPCRHPASFTGLYALRPSHGRVSYQQVTNTFLGQEAVRSCAGPMCRSPGDIRLFMASLAAQEPWSTIPRPPLRRAMEMTREKLLAAGHSAIDFVPYETKEAAEIIWKMWLADGAEEIRRDSGLTGEPLPPSVELIYGHSNASLRPLSVTETWQNQQKRAILAQKLLDRWQKTAENTGTGRPIDGLIMPNTPAPTMRHDTRQPWNYGVLSPLLDLTTGVFPVTKVDLEKDVIPRDWQPISEKDREAMKFCKPFLSISASALQLATGVA